MCLIFLSHFFRFWASLDEKNKRSLAEWPKICRLIDANLGRIKEGIRVIEDINRYIFDDKGIATALKQLRHKAKTPDALDLLAYRDVEGDVLRPTMPQELERTDPKSILIANYKRAQEAARVLEEIYKIFDPSQAEVFKQIRYELYRLEKANLLSR